MTFENYTLELLLKIQKDVIDKNDDLYTELVFNEITRPTNQAIIKKEKVEKFSRKLNIEINKRIDKQNDLIWLKTFFKNHTPLNQNCIFKNSVNCLICNRVKRSFEN